MPNFIRYKTKNSFKKQDGINPQGSDNTIPVGELTERQAEEYANLLSLTFLQHWENQKRGNK